MAYDLVCTLLTDLANTYAMSELYSKDEAKMVKQKMTRQWRAHPLRRMQKVARSLKKTVSAKGKEVSLNKNLTRTLLQHQEVMHRPVNKRGTPDQSRLLLGPCRLGKIMAKITLSQPSRDILLLRAIYYFLSETPPNEGEVFRKKRK